MLRLTQHRERFAAAHGALGFECFVVRRARPTLDLENQKKAQREDPGADQDEVLGADAHDQESRETRARHATQSRAAANEAEDPLRLTRIVDIVGERQNWLMRKIPSRRRPKKKKAADTHGCPVWKRNQKPTKSETITT